MQCLDSNAVVDYVDGDLPAPERARIETHLAACGDCRLLVASLARSSAPRDAGGAADDADALVRGASVGRFLVLELLGRGGMGVVYRMYDPELDRQVALKLVRPRGLAAGAEEEARARLAREAKALARLAHPNVVAVYDVGVRGDDVYVAMELVPGKTLRQWLADAPRPPAAILDVLAAAGSGLAAAHDAGLVHRDFKPDNVIIGDDGRTRVLDFGLVTAVGGAAAVAGSGDDLAADPSITRTGAVVGTPAFMAPEQHLGGQVDARSDQFSFCVTLCEALAGERPVAGSTPAEIAASLANGEPRVPAAVPTALRGVMERGLARDPARRYPGMHELLADLARARRPRTWPWRAALAGSVLALVVAAALVMWRVRGRDAAPCAGAEAQLAGVWDAEVRARVADAFRASGHADPAGALQHVAKALDAYTAGWTQLRTHVCRATRVERVQSEEMLDARERCLERRLGLVRGFTQALVKGVSAPEVDAAIVSAAALDPLEPCATATPRGRGGAAPADPAQRAVVTRGQAQLAAARAAFELGRFDDCRRLAQQVVAAAREAKHDGLLGEALAQLGMGQAYTGDYAASEKSLRESVKVAARAEDDDTLATAWTQMILALLEQGRYAESVQLADVAEAAVARAGGDAQHRVRLDHLLADAYSWVDLDEAARRIDTAVAVAEAELGHGRDLVFALVSQGDIYIEQGRYAEAEKSLDRTIAIGTEVMGADHPTRGYPDMEYGKLRLAQGRYDDAQVELEHAIAFAERLGANQNVVFYASRDLGAVWLAKGDPEKAIGYERRAVAVATAEGGPQDYRVSMALGYIGAAQLRLGKLDEAEATWEQALAIRRNAAPATERASVGRALVALAEISARRGDRARAVARLEEAIPVLEQHRPKEAVAARTRLAEIKAGR